jgi:Protein of unknown function (DUF2442)
MTATEQPPYHRLEPIAKRVRFDDHSMFVELAHGGELVVPLEWFPPLAKLPRETLNEYELVADATVIHWGGAVDEWLSVASLLGHPD